MKKVDLEIHDITLTGSSSGAYTLLLGVVGSDVKLPVVIGGSEAQSIALELENMKSSRPLTHDLFKSFADSFTITIEEVLIYNLIEGIFHAKLMCRQGENAVEIDTRTSDAVALAVRFKCPIYTHEFILKDAGIILDQADDSDTKEEAKTKTPAKKQKKDIASLSLNELNTQLEKALNTEDYEEASKLRDEINRRDGNQN